MPERFRGGCPFGAPGGARGLSRTVSSASASLPERRIPGGSSARASASDLVPAEDPDRDHRQDQGQRGQDADGRQRGREPLAATATRGGFRGRTLTGDGNPKVVGGPGGSAPRVSTAGLGAAADRRQAAFATSAASMLRR